MSGDPTGSTPQPGDRPATPPGDRAAAGPDGGQAAGEHLRGVARGGALNLLGAVIWGASNFVLLAILTRGMGADSAGVVIIGIAVFNILATLTGMGCSSGLVRMTSQYRATRQADLLRPTLLVAVVPVAVAGVLAAVFMVVAGSWLADVFGGGQSTEEVQDTLRAMAPFLPFAAVYWVLIQGSRGYDTMRPVVVVDKIGRGLVLPAVAWIGVAAGLGPAGIGAAWAATNLVALFPSVWVTARLVRRTEARQGVEGRSQEPVRSVASTFWRFTAPRGVGQVSEVAVNWMDTLIVGAILGTTAAGIYGAGTRYVLPGVFVADAIMQVVGPRISGMLSRDEHAEAQHMLKVATGWQSTVMWPLYLMVLVFAPVLLRLFGPEIVEATSALRWLAGGLLLAALAGPAASVILMSGRSMLSMVNTLVLVAVNLFGNLVLVPRFGLGGAGFVWAVTILIAAALPAVQARWSLDLTTTGRPAAAAALLASAAYLPVALVALAVVGQSWSAVLVAGVVGTVLYGLGIRRFGGILELDVLTGSIRRGRPAAVAS